MSPEKERRIRAILSEMKVLNDGLAKRQRMLIVELNLTETKPMDPGGSRRG